ncbi:MAG TPA: DUF488 domain-containing protein [Bacteroidota bacterium]|nr:DUF488 domain-containing protein [Bacteroidota bacterium]
MVKIKRVYDNPTASDGIRVLVDRLWPRGVSKSRAAVSLWLKEIAPTGSLRIWFGHRPERWNTFRSRYQKELQEPERKVALEHLRALSRRGTISLIYAAKDTRHNSAVVLAGMLRRG